MVESTRPSPLPAIDRAMDSRVFTPGFSHAGRRPDGDFPEARWSALCQATELPEQAVTHRLYFSLKAAVNRLSATQSFVYPSAWKDAGCHPNGELRSSWKSMRARRLAAGSAFNCRFSDEMNVVSGVWQATRCDRLPHRTTQARMFFLRGGPRNDSEGACATAQRAVIGYRATGSQKITQVSNSTWCLNAFCSPYSSVS